MKVEIIQSNYSFGVHRVPGEKPTLTDEQAYKLIKRGLAKEFKKRSQTKEYKLNRETK